MPVSGTLINCALIVAGTLLGLAAKKVLPEHVKNTVMQAVGLVVMFIGIGGAMQLLGQGGRISIFAAQEGFGFQGISVALIGGSDPLGVLFAGLFYGILKYGGTKLNLIGAPSEVINIITGTVVFFIAISHVFRIRVRKGGKKNG